MLTTPLKRKRRVSGGKHTPSTHSFTLQKWILSFVHSSQIISGWLFLAHKSFANCLATTHLVLPLPTHLSAIRTTYSSFHSNGMVSNKSSQRENKCEQSGDTFLSPPSSWLGLIWHQASHCPDGGHFSAPALAHSLPRHWVPVFRWKSACRKIAAWVSYVTALVVYNRGCGGTSARAGEEGGGRQRLALYEKRELLEKWNALIYLCDFW